MNFSTYEQYVSWRAEWRQNYKVISDKLRELKHIIAEKSKAGFLPGEYQTEMLSLRKEATKMLNTRLLAKIRSSMLREKLEISDAIIQQRADIILAQREVIRLEAKARSKLKTKEFRELVSKKKFVKESLAAAGD